MIVRELIELLEQFDPDMEVEIEASISTGQICSIAKYEEKVIISKRRILLL